MMPAVAFTGRRADAGATAPGRPAAGAGGKPCGAKIGTLQLDLVSLLTLSAFFLLYIFRSLDDNNLVSWH
jgi:hypothetical protein